VQEFKYTFDNLAAHVEDLLLENLGLRLFSIYVQDYGVPVGYRIASKHPDAIQGIVVQNGNAYEEGTGGPFGPMKPFWANRNSETERLIAKRMRATTRSLAFDHTTAECATESCGHHHGSEAGGVLLSER
jgi:pimeloyl-ACP methyl ester carboxylesterase